MKKILAITAALIMFGVSSAYATEVTYTTTQNKNQQYMGAGITMFRFTDVDDAETWSIKGPIKGWWAVVTSNPSTQTSAGIAVTSSVSAGTYTFTFYPGEDNAGVNFFIAR